MQHLDTYYRFQKAFAEQKESTSDKPDSKKGNERTPPDSHAAPRVQEAIHAALKAIHRHIFDNENVDNLAEAMQRHAAIVALCEPNRSDSKK